MVESDNPTDAILDEAQKNYDLLVLGATQNKSQSGELFNPIIDDLVRFSPCHIIIVQAEYPGEDWRPRRVLVPTNGSMAAKNAAELSFYVSNTTNHETIVLHNIEGKAALTYDYQKRAHEQQMHIGRSILEEYEKLAGAHGAEVKTTLREEANTEQAILAIAEQNHVNLIIIGTNIHPGSSRLYLGRRVEAILNNTRCPVLIFNT